MPKLTETYAKKLSPAKSGTDKHWDVVKYLRDEHINNNNEPNERTILKDLGKIWGSKPSSKDTFDLFPLAPSKQGRKIAGLPQSTRKGGY